MNQRWKKFKIRVVGKRLGHIYVDLVSAHDRHLPIELSLLPWELRILIVRFIAPETVVPGLQFQDVSYFLVKRVPAGTSRATSFRVQRFLQPGRQRDFWGGYRDSGGCICTSLAKKLDLPNKGARFKRVWVTLEPDPYSTFGGWVGSTVGGFVGAKRGFSATPPALSADLTASRIAP